MTEWKIMDFEQMLEQIRRASEQHETQSENKVEVKEVQWRCQVYHGQVLIVDHAQNDFAKVFRFTMNALTELHNQGVKDYRVHIQDRMGNLYFFSIGENTPVAKYRKATHGN